MALSKLFKDCFSEIILSDGGLASELERDQQDLNSDLWSGEVFIRYSSIKLRISYLNVVRIQSNPKRVNSMRKATAACAKLSYRAIRPTTTTSAMPIYRIISTFGCAVRSKTSTPKSFARFKCQKTKNSSHRPIATKTTKIGQKTFSSRA